MNRWAWVAVSILVSAMIAAPVVATPDDGREDNLHEQNLAYILDGLGMEELPAGETTLYTDEGETTVTIAEAIDQFLAGVEASGIALADGADASTVPVVSDFPLAGNWIQVIEEGFGIGPSLPETWTWCHLSLSENEIAPNLVPNPVLQQRRFGQLTSMATHVDGIEGTALALAYAPPAPPVAIGVVPYDAETVTLGPNYQYNCSAFQIYDDLFQRWVWGYFSFMYASGTATNDV